MNTRAYKVREMNEYEYIIEENGVRCFLFIGTSEALLIDTGFGSGDLKGVVNELTKLPVKLVNTHADGDHTGCNDQFDHVWMHPSEYDRYQEKGGRMECVRPLWEGDIIDMGNRQFKVMLFPGHTPGSIMLWDEDNQLLVSGDSVQLGEIFMFGPGRNIAGFIHSMERLSRMSGRIRHIYPSHGTLPIKAEVIDWLKEEALAILHGEADGMETEMFGNRVMLYRKRTAFLCDLKHPE